MRDFYFFTSWNLFSSSRIKFNLIFVTFQWLQSVDNISWQQYPPWYVTINNSMHCVWRICFLSTDQKHNKALWTSFLFKHGSWCVSFTCLSFCSCKLTSHTIEEKTLTNKLSLVPFLFLYFPFLLQFILLLFLFFFFLFSPSAYVDPYWLVLVSETSTSFDVPHASHKGNVHQDGVF